MSIQSDVNELQLIKNELKDLGVRARALRLRAKAIEHRIVEYLASKDQPGIKYKGIAIVVEKKPKRVAKKKQDQDDDALAVLRNTGLDSSQAEKILREILEARRGASEDMSKLKFKPLKEK